MSQSTAPSPHDASGEGHPSAEAFELKGEMSMFVVLRLLVPDPERLGMELHDKIESAPGFFDSMPIVLDIEALTGDDAPVAELIETLKGHGLLPVGIRNANQDQQVAARQAGLGDLPRRTPPAAAAQRRDDTPQPRAEGSPTYAPALTLTRPVRSGQQVYARERDLIVVAPASAGSELLADGSIHVYGPLRGRALAGIGGDKGARIFCQRLEAELIAIAGRYRTYDELDPQLMGKPAQIWLEGDRLRFAAL